MRTIQPSGMFSTGTTLLSASAANLSAMMTSVGRMNSTPCTSSSQGQSLGRFAPSCNHTIMPVTRPLPACSCTHTESVVWSGSPRTAAPTTVGVQLHTEATSAGHCL